MDKEELKILYDWFYQLLMSICISQSLPDVVFVQAVKRLDEKFSDLERNITERSV